MPSIDWFLEGFGAAIADVREKVVETPWFGCGVTAFSPDEGPSLADAVCWMETPQERPIDGPAQEDLGHGLAHER